MPHPGGTGLGSPEGMSDFGGRAVYNPFAPWTNTAAVIRGTSTNKVCAVTVALFLFALFLGSLMGAEVSTSRAGIRAAMNSTREFPVQMEDAEWRKKLGADEYNVLRLKGTERGGTGEYNKFYPKKGFFRCRGCENPLYSYESKFNSGCGWPAFDKCFKGSVVVEVDNTLGMRRVEIMCANCGGHLGHVFEGERFTDTNERHCVNSVSVKYDKGEIPAGLEQEKVV